MELLLSDLRYAWRKLLHSPGFTVVVVLTLSLGIGGTTAVFSFVNALLLRPLPVEEPERLVWIGAQGPSGETAMSFSHLEYEQLAEGRRELSGLAAFGMSKVRVGDGERSFATVGALVSANYFSVLGVKPALGRFPDATDSEAAVPGIVISDAMWRRVFVADPRVLGRTIQLDENPAVVVGVAPPEFGGTISLVGIDVWMPLTMHPILNPGMRLDDGGHAWLQLVGRMDTGWRRAVVAQALSVRARHVGVGSGYRRPAERMVVEPLAGVNGEGGGGARRISVLLFATALLLLAIASVNISGMILARNALRRSEMAVRAALGAAPIRIVRQLLTETLLLWSLGGVGGICLALWLGQIFPAVVPVQEAFPARVGLDLRMDRSVLLFAGAVTLLSGLAFGLLPAWQGAKVDLTSAMKEQFDLGHRRSGMRNALTSAQVACSLLLLVNAGLLLRSLQEIVTESPGFNPEGVVVAPLDMAVDGEVEARRQARMHTFFPEVLRRLSARQDIEAVSIASAVPMIGGRTTTSVSVPGSAAYSGINPSFEVAYTAVSARYFSTMGIPVLRGRAFTVEDRFGTAPVAVVSQTMARQFWPNGDALGKTLQQGDIPLRVVGIVGDGGVRNARNSSSPALYVAFPQQPTPAAMLLVRASPATMATVAEEIQRIDPETTVGRVVPLQDLIVAAMPQRLLVPVLGGFGALGLLLSTIGIYGLVSYSTANRTREFGIRTALGATPRQVLGMVLGRGVMLGSIGIAIGIPLALGVAKLLSPLLGSVGVFDFRTYAAVVLLMIVSALGASFLPARRATRIPPLGAMRLD